MDAVERVEFEKRLSQMKRLRVELGDEHVATELLERATYIHSMALANDGWLSSIEHQSAETMYRAADTLLSLARSNGWQDGEVLTDDGLSGMWKVRAKRAEEALQKLENYCFGLETQVGGFRPEVIRELFARLPEPPLDRLRGSEDEGEKS